MEMEIDTEETEGQMVVKRQKTELVTTNETGPPVVKRFSSLQAPIMLLTGHAAAVYTMEFSPDGRAIASGSADKTIFLWSVYGDCLNYAVLTGHQNTILEVHWTTDGEHLVSASADKTVRAWDVEACVQIKKMGEHDSFVNSCNVARRGPEMVVSGADDSTAKIWDLRVKRSIMTLTDSYQITTVAFSDAADQVFTSGIENVIKTWDIRNQKVVMTMAGHSDTVTGMQLSPDGTHLLGNAMDNTLRMWDVRPYAPKDRCVDVFVGHTHNFEKNLLRCCWSPDGRYVTCGSADRMVFVWEVETRDLLYKLPGHTGSVNEVVFHPKENIIGSAASDKKIYLGDLDL